MYGSCCVMVLAYGGEANGFTLDPNMGEFLLTHPKVFANYLFQRCALERRGFIP